MVPNTPCAPREAGMTRSSIAQCVVNYELLLQRDVNHVESRRRVGLMKILSSSGFGSWCPLLRYVGISQDIRRDSHVLIDGTTSRVMTLWTVFIPGPRLV
jgi:hypothetical protein